MPSDSRSAAITLVIEGPDSYRRVDVPRGASEVKVYVTAWGDVDVRIDGKEDDAD